MESIRLRETIQTDGELVLRNLPCKKGQTVEVTLTVHPNDVPARPVMTGADLIESGLIGMWKDRKDIEDSSAYARRLREEAEQRLP